MISLFLVEDERIARESIRDNVPWQEHDILFLGDAPDGEVALPQLLEKRPDILLTDIKMPFMDGLELARIVRKELPDTRIIILSGHNEFEYARKAITLGVNDYLLKPVSSRWTAARRRFWNAAHGGLSGRAIASHSGSSFSAICTAAS